MDPPVVARSNDGSLIAIHHPPHKTSSSSTGLVVGSESGGSGVSVQCRHPAIARVLASPASSQVRPSDDNADAHHRRDGAKRRRTSSSLQDGASVTNDCRDDFDEEIAIGRGRVRRSCPSGVVGGAYGRDEAEVVAFATRGGKNTTMRDARGPKAADDDDNEDDDNDDDDGRPLHLLGLDGGHEEEDYEDEEYDEDMDGDRVGDGGGSVGVG
jgi:hypothetical protein